MHLFRPFSIAHFVKAIPSSVKQIAVLDRCKETGAIGEPLYMDVINALHNGWEGTMPKVIGGRYGLASKEFTPAMVKAIFEELTNAKPKNGFTIGIEDDITHTNCSFDTNRFYIFCSLDYFSYLIVILFIKINIPHNSW